MDLNSYFRPLSALPCFKCLGLVMLSSDDDWMSVIQNLLRARQKWVCLYRVLGWEGGGGGYADFGNVLHHSGSNGSPLWVGVMDFPPWIGKALGEFHHQVIWRLTEKMSHQSGEGTWTYLKFGEVMDEALLQDIEVYVVLSSKHFHPIYCD